ncbi:MAG: bifunctional helix-turn-helix transcriptional regulator/GNAT family N-acetyltransferase [bacterium]
MDIIKQIGPLAIATRFKRLLDQLIKDGQKVYSDQQLDFQPHWFPVFICLIKSEQPMSITEIASSLQVTHPNVIKITRSMAKKGLIKSLKDKHDARKHLIELTAKGKQLIPLLQPIWNCFESAVLDIFEEIDYDVINVLDRFEQALFAKSMYQRITEQIENSKMSNIEIFEYKPEFQKIFDKLNRQWIEEFFQLEDYDMKILENPQQEIIDKGGFILFAKYNNKICGTCAMMKLNSKSYELSKMSVDKNCRGNKIGKKMVLAAIEKARLKGADSIYLRTDLKLQTALNLYRKMGFSQTQSENLKSDNLNRSSTGITMKLDLV